MYLIACIAGMPSIGLLPLDPLRIKTLEIDQGTGPVSIKLNVRDLDVSNIGTVKINELSYVWFAISFGRHRFNKLVTWIIAPIWILKTSRSTWTLKSLWRLTEITMLKAKYSFFRSPEMESAKSAWVCESYWFLREDSVIFLFLFLPTFHRKPEGQRNYSFQDWSEKWKHLHGNSRDSIEVYHQQNVHKPRKSIQRRQSSG